MKTLPASGLGNTTEPTCSVCGRQNGYAFWEEPERQEFVYPAAEAMFRSAIHQHLADNGDPIWHVEGDYATSNLRILGIVEHIYLEEVARAFPPVRTNPTGHVVYRHFTAEDILLYVGYSSRVDERQVEHKKSAPWWAESARMEVERFGAREDAIAAELTAIRTEHPLWNVQGQSR